MQITPQQVQLIRSTIGLLESKSTVTALAFYQRLLAKDASWRAHAPRDIDVETERLMALLRTAAELADQPDALQARFARASARLFGADAPPWLAGPVGEALLWSMGATLGPDFTPETRTAWENLVQAAMEKEPRT